MQEKRLPPRLAGLPPIVIAPPTTLPAMTHGFRKNDTSAFSLPPEQ